MIAEWGEVVTAWNALWKHQWGKVYTGCGIGPETLYVKTVLVHF